MAKQRWYQNASMTLVMTFMFGIGVGFSLCYAFLNIVDENPPPAEVVAVASVPAEEPPQETTPPESQAEPQPPAAPPAEPSSPAAPPANTLREEKSLSPETLRQLWPGRHVVVTLAETSLDDAWRQFLAEHRPAAVLISPPAPMSGDALAVLAAEIKTASGQGTERWELPLIMVAQEGGERNPLGVSPSPSPWELSEKFSSETVENLGAQTARAAEKAGVAMLLGPSLDVPGPDTPNESKPYFFGSSADSVIKSAIPLARALAKAGVLPVVMHYPGMGAVPPGAKGAQTLAEKDINKIAEIMVPFADAVAADIPAILAGRVAVPAIDPKGRPACASNVLIEDILRHEWNYPGVIIADLRDMGTEPCRSPLPVDSFKAGCDLVLLGKMALTDVVCVLEGIAKAIDGQALDAKVVAESRRRLDNAAEMIGRTSAAPVTVQETTPPPAAPIAVEAPAVETSTPEVSAPQEQPAPPVEETAPAQEAATPPDAPAPPPPAETQNAGNSATAPVAEHKLAQGETLSAVAKKYGVSLADLAKWNDLKDTNSVRAGSLLKIMASEPAAPAETVPVEETPPAEKAQENTPAPPAQTPPAEAVTPAPPSETPPAPAEPTPQAVEPAAEAAPEETSPAAPPAAEPATPAPSPETAPAETPTAETAPAPEPAATETSTPAEESEPAPAPPALETVNQETPPPAETTETVPTPQESSAPSATVEAETTVPENAQNAKEETAYELYTIKAGDNLYRLSKQRNTTPEEIMRINNISSANLVKLGAQIKLPVVK